MDSGSTYVRKVFRLMSFEERIIWVSSSTGKGHPMQSEKNWSFMISRF
jgi:hypothetical protein